MASTMYINYMKGNDMMNGKNGGGMVLHSYRGYIDVVDMNEKKTVKEILATSADEALNKLRKMVVLLQAIGYVPYGKMIQLNVKQLKG